VHFDDSQKLIIQLRRAPVVQARPPRTDTPRSGTLRSGAQRLENQRIESQSPYD
jgi:hypothetical protein